MQSVRYSYTNSKEVDKPIILQAVISKTVISQADIYKAIAQGYIPDSYIAGVISYNSSIRQSAHKCILSFVYNKTII